MENKIGKRIKEKRLDRNLTLEKLAEMVGTTRQTIHRYESGEIVNIPSDKIEAIAEVLNISPAYLMGWEDSNTEEKSSVYGDHNANLEHLKNKPELLELYNDIYESENLQILFDTAKDLTPQDLEKVLRYMKLVIDEEL